MTVKGRCEEELGSPVLREGLEAVYVSNSAKLSWEFDVPRNSKNWLRYFMFPWPHLALPYMDESKVWSNATKFKRGHRKHLECPLFVGWQKSRGCLSIVGRGKAFLCCYATVMEGPQTVSCSRGDTKPDAFIQVKQLGCCRSSWYGGNGTGCVPAGFHCRPARHGKFTDSEARVEVFDVAAKIYARLSSTNS